MVKNERELMGKVLRQLAAEPALRGELERRTISMWRTDLETLTNGQLSALEARVARLVAEAVVLAEQCAPGRIADRLIEQIDERPLRAIKGIPAHMTGGKDIRDLSSQAGGHSNQHVIDLWPRVREQFRAHLRLYFARLAAGEKGRFARHRRRVRVVNLAQVLWFFLNLSARTRARISIAPL